MAPAAAISEVQRHHPPRSGSAGGHRSTENLAPADVEDPATTGKRERAPLCRYYQSVPVGASEEPGKSVHVLEQNDGKAELIPDSGQPMNGCRLTVETY